MTLADAALSPSEGIGYRCFAYTRAAAIAFVVTLGLSGGVFASEYGVGTYRPGQVDLFAGMLPAAGGVLVKNYFMFQDASLTAQPNNAPVRFHTRTISLH